MQLIIDRFEGPIAVCEREDGSFEHILRAQLPKPAREGSVLVCVDDVWALDLQIEQERRRKLFEMQEGLFG